jgi:purine catabolism regulator
MKLQDLLDQQEFALSVISGHSDQLQASIGGAHVLEVEEPLRWVPPGWIVLTTGIRLWRRPAEQRRLVADLASGGVAALGFGVGVVFDDLPAALVDEARRHDFTVFEVPELTTFRDIVRFVNGQLLSQDMNALRRTIAVRDRLVDAVAEPDPEAALVGRLAQVVRASVSLFDPVGNVVSASRPLDAADHWRRLQRLAPHAEEMPLVVDRNLQAAVILVDGFPVRWVVVTTDHASLASSVVERGLRDATALLTALHRIRLYELDVLRKGRRELLLAIFQPAGDDPRAPRAERSLVARGRGLGVDIDDPHLRVVLASDFVGGALVEELAGEVEATLARQSLTSPTAVIDDRLVMIVPESYPLDQLWGGRSGQLAVGVGLPSGGLHGLSRSRREAEIACVHARRTGPGTTVDQGALALVDWMVLQFDIEQLAPRAARVLEPLSGQQELLETLEAYLQQNMNASETARHMHLHKNSLGYRLRRIEQELGLDLRDPRDLAEIQVALTVMALGG